MAWRYDANDNNRDAPDEWITLYNLHVVYSSKVNGMFFSARWLKEYTPDLCLILRALHSDNTTATR